MMVVQLRRRDNVHGKRPFIGLLCSWNTQLTAEEVGAAAAAATAFSPAAVPWASLLDSSYSMLLVIYPKYLFHSPSVLMSVALSWAYRLLTVQSGTRKREPYIWAYYLKQG